MTGMRLLPLALLLAACATPAAVEMPDDVRLTLVEPDTLELLSLHPFRAQELLGVEKSFYTYPLLGRTEPDEETREALMKALFKSIKVAAKTQDESRTTFAPRHGIRARRGGETVDVLISFESAWLVYYRNGKPVGGTQMTAQARDPFDATLKSAGVRLP
jgi:hypothetical protein